MTVMTIPTSPSALAAPRGLLRTQRAALALGAVVLLLTAVYGFWRPVGFFRAFLIGYLFCWNIALGSLGILMLHHLTGGAWGVAIRCPLEAAARCIPVLLLLFLPMVLGQGALWWTSHGVPAPLGPHQRLYLSEPLFLLRAGLYFGVWLLLSRLLCRWSCQTDAGLDRRDALRSLSGPGLCLYVLTITFASVDWLLALQPGWYSTIFGLVVIAGQGLSALCFATATVVLLRASGPLGGLVQQRHILDLGKLVLAFVMLWGYMAFSQLLIIWAGNLPQEIPWHYRRLHGGWQWLGAVLLIGHLLLPLLLLLLRGLRRRGRPFLLLLGMLLFMRLCDAFWLTAPQYHERFTLSWLDLVVPLGLIGLWLSYYIYQLRRRPLLPQAELGALGGGDATAA